MSKEREVPSSSAVDLIGRPCETDIFELCHIIIPYGGGEELSRARNQRQGVSGLRVTLSGAVRSRRNEMGYTQGILTPQV